MYGFSFFSTSPIFFSLNISFVKSLHIHMCDHLLGLFDVIKVDLKVYKRKITVDCLLAIVICFLRYSSFISNSIRMNNYNWFRLYHALDTWSNRRGTYLQCLTRFVGYDIPGWVLLEQTHVYEHIFVFLSTYFLWHFFPNTIYVDFWSRHLWIDVELNNENILILV
jgi:hypothetical protein